MATQYAYKMVRKPIKGTSFTSLFEHKLANFSNAPKYHRVNYDVGEWATAVVDCPNQFLFVFKTRQDARDWRKGRCEDWQIWKSEVINMTETRPGVSEGHHAFNPKDPNAKWPKGTMFATAVKLLKKVS
jgi:hypothetical protein